MANLIKLFFVVVAFFSLQSNAFDRVQCLKGQRTHIDPGTFTNASHSGSLTSFTVLPEDKAKNPIKICSNRDFRVLIDQEANTIEYGILMKQNKDGEDDIELSRQECLALTDETGFMGVIRGSKASLRDAKKGERSSSTDARLRRGASELYTTCWACSWGDDGKMNGSCVYENENWQNNLGVTYFNESRDGRVTRLGFKQGSMPFKPAQREPQSEGSASPHKGK